MKILVLGGGGREHALCWKLRQSPVVDQVYCVPGNAGISQDAVCLHGDITAPGAMADLAGQIGADLIVVGPEAPLVAGVVDEFRARKLAILGPTRAAAQLEGSKVYAKEFMQRHRIPTADFTVLESAEDTRHTDRFGFPVVLKADGLAAGKGVLILHEESEARAAAENMLAGHIVGDVGRRAVLERHLPGEEVSFIVLADGRKQFYALPPTQDHKRVFDNDQGPNTGGMGAYCDLRILTPRQRDEIVARIVEPTLEGMRRDGCPYTGFLYFGLMMTADGPYVLEFNVRLGDPETQPLLFRLESDLAPLLDAVARDRFPDATVEWLSGPTVCVVAASAGYPGAYESGKEIFGIDDAEAAGAKVFHAGTRFAEGRLVTSGGRVLGVTAAGDDLRTAIDNAYAALSTIQFEGMHYRRDIGEKGLARYP